MKFTVKEPDGFKHGHANYEFGNSHDSDNIDDMNDELVMVFHRAGWVDVKDHETVERNIHHVELIPDNVMIGAQVGEL